MPYPLLLLLLWLLPLPAAPEHGAEHPADGPDADVRILVDGEKVRFQIVLNLAFIDEIVDVAREDESSIHPVEYPWVRQTLYDYFHDTNRVVVDGIEVSPVDNGFDVIDPDLSLLPLFPQTGRRGLTKVQLVYDYPVKSKPQQVRMYWGAYPPDLAVGDELYMPTVQIRPRLIAYGLESELLFTAEEPEYTWHDSGKTAADFFLAVPEAPPASTLHLPLFRLFSAAGALLLLLWAARPARRRLPRMGGALALGALCVWPPLTWTVEVPSLWGKGVALPTAEEADQVFRPLHANIYRAFDYTAPSDVYDALAQSVDGPLLESLYDQVYRGLIQQEQGGAVSRVREVRVLESDVASIGLVPGDGRIGFDVVARWQVDGRVTHFGHSHDRTNEYRARYTVVLTDQGWRIGGTRMLEQQRISAAPVSGG